MLKIATCYKVAQPAIGIAGSNREHERIDVFHGGIGEERREAIKSAFNANPARHSPAYPDCYRCSTGRGEPPKQLC